MNTITDMEYRIFSLKKIRTLFVGLLIILAAANTAKAIAPPPIPVVATADTGYVNGYNGNSNLVQAFANDSFNNLPLVGSAMKVTYTSPDAHIGFDTLSGVVSISAGLAAGTYTLNYTVYDTSDLLNFSSAAVTIYVSAPAIVANTDAASVNGLVGNATLLNIYANDSINGITTTAGAVTTSIITGSGNAGITLNTTTGNVSVGTLIPANLYTIQYKNCDTLNPSNCDTAMVNVTVTAPAILASGESVSVNGYNGGSNLIDVIANDSFNGAATRLGEVVLTVVTPASASGVTLNTSTGKINVAPLTPAGNYTLIYRICDSINVSSCDTALVNITVTAPSILASGESVSVNGYNGGSNLIDVIVNDSFNGAATRLGEVVLTIVTPATAAGITLNTSTGKINVAAYTRAGNYTLVYRICDSLNAANCDTALVNIMVTAPPIIANPDYASANSYNGAFNIINIFSNDSINLSPATLSKINFTLLSSPAETKVFLNPFTGYISVFPYTPAGLYSFVYRICDTANTSNCDTAIAYVNVNPPVIIANNDNGIANGYAGNNNILNVISNDSLNNKATSLSEINLSLVSGSGHAGVTLNLSTGVVAVAPLTPAGIYTIQYKICDTLNTANCDTGIVTLNVSAPSLSANADVLNVNGYNGGSNLLNVLSNDLLNGSTLSTTAVYTTLITPASSANITLDTTNGFISVSAPMAAGDYSLVYRICDTLNPGSCDTAIVFIHVKAPVLMAGNDTGDVNGYVGTDSLLYILANDSINATPIALGGIYIQLASAASHANITLDSARGVVVVAPYTPAGNYTLAYLLTDTLNSSNIDTGIVYIRVSAPKLEAIDDTVYVNGYDSNMYVLHVTDNDSLNGAVVPSAAVWADTYVPASSPLIQFDSLYLDLSVLPRLAAGVYTMKYKIFDTLNLSNTDTATIVIYVSAPPIIAHTDIDTLDGYHGDTTTVQVLNNDTLNNWTPIPGEVKISVLAGSGFAGVWLNDSTGFIHVAPLTPAGLYTIKYQICDTLNLGNCDSTTDSIYVVPPYLQAMVDSVSIIGYDSNLNLVNVLTNDSINFRNVRVGEVKLRTLIPATHTGIQLNDTTGVVSFRPLVPSGYYTIQYSISDTINLNNTDTDYVVIHVLDPGIWANNDTAFVNGNIGTDSVYQVLANDSIHHLMATNQNVSIHIVTGSGRSSVRIDTLSGFLQVDSLTPAGIYHIVYAIADTLNPGNRDTAILYINISSPPIYANADSAYAIGYTGNLNVLNVLSNDSINGAVITAGRANMTIVKNSGNGGIILNPANGQLSVFPGTKAGYYTVIYRLCDTLNPSNCDTALLGIYIEGPSIIATNDTTSVNGFIGNPYAISVIDNDSIMGEMVYLGQVNMFTVNPFVYAGITFDSVGGWVNVAPLTPAGTYVMDYRICDTLNPGICDTAQVTVYVTSGEISANNDTASVNGYFGMNNLVNVLDNDSLNGTIALASQLHIKELVSSGTPMVTFDTLSGYVSVAPRTPAGLYTLTYQITDTNNLSNFDTAQVSITVYAVGPMAMDDSASTASGIAVVISPLLNDMDADTNLWGATLQIVTQGTNGVAIADTIAQTITYTPNAGFTGYDTLYYSVCDSGMVPVLCANAMIVIHVLDTMSVDTIISLDNLCFGDTLGVAAIGIQGGFPPYTISWNTTPVQTGPFAINLAAGTYTAMVVDTVFDTLYVNVTIKQPLSALNATASSIEPKCFGEFNGKLTAMPSGGTSPYTYLWSNGSINNFIDKINAGSYFVDITDSVGCTVKKNFVLTEPLPISATALQIVDVVCKNSPEGSIQLAVSGGTNPYKFLWNTSDTTMDLFNKPDGTYRVTILDANNCSNVSVFTILYSKDNCESDVFTPQGFSPDGDGINDEFKIEGIEKYPDNYLRIYNRWGGLVFEEHGYKNTWKGTAETGIGSNGEKLPTGTYFYVLELETGKPVQSGYVYISK